MRGATMASSSKSNKKSSSSFRCGQVEKSVGKSLRSLSALGAAPPGLVHGLFQLSTAMALTMNSH
jgi:hypothetical protein